MSQQQSDRMAALEGAVLAEMDAVAQRKMAGQGGPISPPSPLAGAKRASQLRGEPRVGGRKGPTLLRGRRAIPPLGDGGLEWNDSTGM